MTITQRYWLVWSPGLILAGFFLGWGGLLGLFIPSYLGYYGHRKEWSLGKFALVASGLAFAGLMFACLTFS